jgi:DNA-binding response OmpR family regulator
MLIEGKRGVESQSFMTGLTRKGFVVESQPSGSAALKRLPDFAPDLVLVDAASMRTNGSRICQSIRQYNNKLPIILILSVLPKHSINYDVNALLYHPFTLQKLINRIRPLLPVEGKNLIKHGPLVLDIDERRILCNGHQTSITPRLVMLLKTLLEHPGEVIDRASLFSKVWETEYTGDTRTLDVHISWLRKAIEKDPRNPELIVTSRGVGYRLDIDRRTISGDTTPLRKKIK